MAPGHPPRSLKRCERDVESRSGRRVEWCKAKTTVIQSPRKRPRHTKTQCSAPFARQFGYPSTSPHEISLSIFSFLSPLPHRPQAILRPRQLRSPSPLPLSLLAPTGYRNDVHSGTRPSFRDLPLAEPCSPPASLIVRQFCCYKDAQVQRLCQKLDLTAAGSCSCCCSHHRRSSSRGRPR